MHQQKLSVGPKPYRFVFARTKIFLDPCSNHRILYQHSGESSRKSDLKGFTAKANSLG